MGTAITKKENYINLLKNYSEELVAKGEDALEVMITEQIAEGKPIIDICRDLHFPSVYILAWLRKEHRDLLQAAETLHKDKTFNEIDSDAQDIGEHNFRSEKAKADVRVNVLKNNKLVKDEAPEIQGNEGMTFSINVVLPDYAKEEIEVVNE